jgi:uncharacterized membrane protein YgaE (UPF0421/DUF939 family)
MDDNIKAILWIIGVFFAFLVAIVLITVHKTNLTNAHINECYRILKDKSAAELQVTCGVLK